MNLGKSVAKLTAIFTVPLNFYFPCSTYYLRLFNRHYAAHLKQYNSTAIQFCEIWNYSLLNIEKMLLYLHWLLHLEITVQGLGPISSRYSSTIKTLFWISIAFSLLNVSSWSYNKCVCFREKLQQIKKYIEIK